MSETNTQLLTDIFDALAVGETRPLLDAMADDFCWRFAGEWSWARDWGTTKREVRQRLLQPLMEQFSSYRCRAQEVIAEGDRVVVLARASARTVRGADYAQAYCYVFRVGGGQLREVTEYCDTSLVERVLVLPGERD